MKKNQIFILLTCLFFGSTVFAQSQSTAHYCGHDLVINSLERQYPGYSEQINKVFEDAKRRGRENRLSRSQSVYTINVAVHMVWKDSVEILSDALIQGQIAALNADFRRMNPDAGNVRPIFANVVGDPMIEFNLDTIIRVQTNSDFEVDFLTGGLPDNVKQTMNGGSDAMDTELFLNLWICEIQPITIAGIPLGQILGYAYPPAGLPNWPAGQSAPSPELDGVVIDFRAIGPNNPTPIDIGMGPIPIEGRTPVHEIGHYLGLRHIWGDGGGLSGTDGCTVDDGVADTPNAADQSNFDCDATKNTCIDAMNDLPDMIENYMDYSAETCMNSFTIGQIDIMRGVLQGPRCSLVNLCGITFVEAGYSPSITSGCSPLTVDFMDNSMGNPTSWEWTFPGGTPATSTMQNPTVVYNTPGSYDVSLKVSDTLSFNIISVADQIVVEDVPTASFSSTLTGETITLTNNSAGATSYDWNFGDGNTSTQMAPTHTYTSSGTYTVTLTATNNCGTDITTEMVTIVISSINTLEGIVNFSVSPNPNAGNFDIILSGLPANDLVVEIHNIYGQQVYQSPVDFRTGQAQIEVDLNIAANGIYVVSIHSANKISYKKINIIK